MTNETNKSERKKRKANIYRIIYITLFYFTLAMIWYSVIIGFVHAHEIVHKQIYDSYDIGSRIEINYLTLSGATITSREIYDERCNDSCRLAHNINEIVGYQLLYIVWILMFIVVFNSAKVFNQYCL